LTRFFARFCTGIFTVSPEFALFCICSIAGYRFLVLKKTSLNMKKFRSLLKVVTGKTSKSSAANTEHPTTPVINHQVLSGLKRVFHYLDNQHVLPRSLYKEPGFLEEIASVEALIKSGKITDSFLVTLRSTHSIASAVINVLAAHEPIIPIELYDHFMSPMSNLDELIEGVVRRSYVYDLVLKHLMGIIRNRYVHMSAKDMANSFGAYVLRSADDNPNGELDSFEIETRCRTFEKVLMRYTALRMTTDVLTLAAAEAEKAMQAGAPPAGPPSTGKQQQLQLQQRKSQSNSSLMVSTDGPPLGSSVPSPALPTSSTTSAGAGAGASAPLPAPAPLLPAQPSSGGQTSYWNASQIGNDTVPPQPLVPETIQERSVKIVFSDPAHRPPQSELTRMLAKYGEISNVRTLCFVSCLLCRTRF
jgi:hypothetical protein